LFHTGKIHLQQPVVVCSSRGAAFSPRCASTLVDEISGAAPWQCAFVSEFVMVTVMFVWLPPDAPVLHFQPFLSLHARTARN
jgi:hypothetical protein